MLLCILVENDDIDKMIHIIEMELEQRGEERGKEDYIYIKGPYYAPVQVHTCSACLFKTPPPHKQPSLP